MKLPLWQLTTLRRKLFEMAGNDRYSRPAFGNIQQKLDRLFKGPGFYVEAGAVDGFFESNTYYLERFRGWRGVLIEPVPDMFRRITVNRPYAKAFNCALVASNFGKTTVPIYPDHAMSYINTDSSLAGRGSKYINVPARTLTSVLDEANVGQIDLLSLDVEGFEIHVLGGLDLMRHRPRYILIECRSEQARQEIDAFLSGYYRCTDIFTYRDFLYSAL